MRLTLSHGRINITLARHGLIKPGENNIVDQDIVYYLLKLDSFVKCYDGLGNHNIYILHSLSGKPSTPGWCLVPILQCMHGVQTGVAVAM